MKNLFSRIFQKHGSQKAAEVVNVALNEEVKFGQATLADGVTVVTFPEDAPMVGEPINVVVDGNEMPAPDGEHALADGTTIVVVGGVVTEVRPVAPAEEAPAAPVPAEEMAEETEVSAPVKRLIESTIKESIFAIEESYKAQVEELKAQLAEKDVIIEKIAENIAKFSEQPSAKPTEEKVKFKPKQNESPIEIALRIAKAKGKIENLKNN